MRLPSLLGLFFSLFLPSAALYSAVARFVPHFSAPVTSHLQRCSDGAKLPLSSTTPFSSTAAKRTHTTLTGTIPLLGITISSPFPSHRPSIPPRLHGNISRGPRIHPPPREQRSPGIPSPHSTPPFLSSSVATRARFLASSFPTAMIPLNCSTCLTKLHQRFSPFPTTGQVNRSDECVTRLLQQME